MPIFGSSLGDQAISDNHGGIICLCVVTLFRSAYLHNIRCLPHHKCRRTSGYVRSLSPPFLFPHHQFDARMSRYVHTVWSMHTEQSMASLRMAVQSDSAPCGNVAHEGPNYFGLSYFSPSWSTLDKAEVLPAFLSFIYPLIEFYRTSISVYFGQVGDAGHS